MKTLNMNKKKLYKIDIAGSLRQLSTGESVEFTMNEVKPQTVRNIASREGKFTVNEIGIIIKVTKL